MVTTKKQEENISNNIDNIKKIKQSKESFFSDVENILKNNSDINNIEENKERINTSCDDLGSDTNIKDLINLPYNINPENSNE